MKSSKQIEFELKQHSDYCIAYCEAIETLKLFERKFLEFRRGKTAKKATSQKKRRNSHAKSTGCKCQTLVGNLSLREEELPTQATKFE